LVTVATSECFLPQDHPIIMEHSGALFRELWLRTAIPIQEHCFTSDTSLCRIADQTLCGGYGPSIRAFQIYPIISAIVVGCVVFIMTTRLTRAERME
jgi:hypothetical protein